VNTRVEQALCIVGWLVFAAVYVIMYGVPFT